MGAARPVGNGFVGVERDRDGAGLDAQKIGVGGNDVAGVCGCSRNL